MTGDCDAAVRTEVVAESVGLIRLNRPERLNAISDALIDGLVGAVDRFTRDREIRAMVVTGAGKAFCAGADIVEFSALGGPLAFLAFLDRLGAALDAIERCPKPSVAALHGAVMGGGLELALACDLRVADPTARIGLPEIRLGLLPGGGGTVRLSRLVPPGVARAMLMTGDPIEPAEGLAHGLLARVVDAGTAERAAIEMASKLASLAPVAMAAAKRLLLGGAAVPPAEALELERRTVAGLFATEDRAEGVSAFLERRTPRFGGR